MFRQVRWGEIKSGGASYGLVWSGRHGRASLGFIGCGKVWQVRLGKVRFDLVLCGLLGQAWLVRCDMVERVLVWQVRWGGVR